MRILLVEDDKKISKNVAFFLEKYGFIVDLAENLVVAEKVRQESEHDLILLDWMLPDGEGVQFLNEIRAKGDNSPVIMLTARSLLEDKIEAFNFGADDYLTKPFQLPELLVRIKSVVRRTVSSDATPIYQFGDLTVDTNKCEVKLKDKVLDISAKTYSVFEYLVINSNRVVARDEIFEKVLDIEPDASNAVDVYIANIRSLLGKKLGNSLIKTVKGRGYMLCTD